MADVSKVIEIAFRGVDGLSSTTRGIGSSLSDLARSGQAVTAPFAGLADGIMKVDAALSALAIAVAIYTTKSAMDLQSSQIDLQKQFKASDGTVQSHSKELRALGESYGKTQAQATASVGNFMKANNSYVDSLTLSKVAMAGSIAGEMDLDKSTQQLIASMSSFGFKVKDAGKYMDINNAIADASGADLGQLGEAYAVAGANASQAGFSMEEFSATLAPLIEQTNSGSEAGNAFKAIIANLTNPTKEATDVLTKLGISLKDSNGQWKTSKQLLEEYLVKNKAVTQVEQQKNNAVIGGTENFAKLSIMQRDTAKTAELVIVANKSVGASQKEVDLNNQKATSSYEKLRNAITNLGADIGLKYLDNTKGLIDANTGLVKSFSSVTEGANFTKLMAMVKEFVSGAAAEINKLATSFPKAFELVDFKGFERSLDNLGKTFGGIFTIDLNDPKQVAAAIQFVVDSIESLVDVTSGMVKQFGAAWEQIKSGIKAFNGLDTASKQSSGELLGIAKVANTVFRALEGLGDGLSAIGTGLSALALGGVVKKLLELNDGAGKGKASIKGLVESFATLGAGAASAGGKVVDSMNPEKWNLKKLSSGLTDINTKLGGLSTLAKGGILAGAAAGGASAGLWLYENVTVVRTGLDSLRDTLMNSVGLTNEAQLANELLAESFKINALIIERYKKETGDANVTLENHQEKLGAWIAKKKEESEASLKAAAVMKESGDQTKSSTEKLDENKKSLDAHAKSATSAAASTKDFKVETSLLKDVKITDVLKEMNSAMSDSSTTIKNLSDQFSGIGSRIDGLNGLLIKSGKLSSEQSEMIQAQLDDETYYRSEVFEMEKKTAEQRLKMGEIILGNTEGIKALTDQEISHLDKTKEYPAESQKKIEALTKETKSYSDTNAKIKELEEGLKKVVQASGQNMSGGVVDLKASAETAKSALESLSSSFKNTGDRAGDLTKSFLNLHGGNSDAQDLLLDQLEVELSMRKDSFDLQMKTIEKTNERLDLENRLLELKIKQAEKTASGAVAPIVIKADGLEPALAMVLTNIIEKAQVVATQEGRNQLIGLS